MRILPARSVTARRRTGKRAELLADLTMRFLTAQICDTRQTLLSDKEQA